MTNTLTVADSTLYGQYYSLNQNFKLHLTPDYGYFALKNDVLKKHIRSTKSQSLLVNLTAQHILSLADGTHTISDAVEICKSKLGDPEENFSNKLLSFFEQQVNAKMISLSDKPKYVPIEITGDVNMWLPLHAMIELTTCCNLKCIHCYRFSADESTPSQPETMETEQCLNIMDQMRENGLQTIEFSGGEPLLHKNIQDIVNKATEYFSKVSIITNGVLITDELCEYFSKYADQLSFSISLDGSNEQIHDQLRGVGGAFKATTSAIKKLTSNGLKVRAGTTLSSSNFFDFENIIILAKELGCDGLAFGPVFPFGRGATIPPIASSNEEAIKVFEHITKITESYNDFLGLATQKLIDMTSFIGNCGAGHRSVAIAPNGDIRPCVSMPTAGPVIGNILIEKYKDIFKKPLIRTLRYLRAPETETCGDCERINFCKPCILRGLYSYANCNINCNWAKSNNLDSFFDISALKDPYAKSVNLVIDSSCCGA